jgi:23S rRNA (guanosine2251-2'-O)-methyltransferase
VARRKEYAPKSRKKNTSVGKLPQKAKTSTGVLWLTGINNVRECLLSPHVEVFHLVLKKGFESKELEPFPKNIRKIWLKEDDPDIHELHQGIGCQASIPGWGDYQSRIEKMLRETNKEPLILILDQVEDPNNLGQIIRTCDGAGVDAVFIPGRRSAQLTQAAAQTSQGAFAWVPVFNVGNLHQALEFLRSLNFWIYGFENRPEAELWRKANFKGPVALVLGSEGRGIRQLTLKTCDNLLYLPMQGRINSLNVSATAAAVLFEAVRQRHKP